MNKTGKAALCLGAGAMLLAGGGGTMALWNASVTAKPGVVYAGDLDLVQLSAGAWFDSDGTLINNIRDYRVVPGDRLTFTQPLQVVLEGDSIQAELSASSSTGSGFNGGDLEVSAVSLRTIPDGNPLPSLLTTSTTVEASLVFEFKQDVSGRSSAGLSHRLDDITYILEQVPVE